MKKLLKKIFLPIFLSVLCGFLCGKLMFSIYEDKEKNILTSNVIYLLEDTSYNDYNTMKSSFVSNNYIYYEENGKYNTVIAMTKNRDNIDKIEKAYNKDFKIVEYLLSDDEINAAPIEPPFKEKTIDGETSFDYWMRTLNVILDSNGTPEDILKHPDKTYPAYRWATVINNGYIAFWDSEYDHDEFVITDIGMTSENEKGWNGITIHNVKKTNFLISLLKRASSDIEKRSIAHIMLLHKGFTENFMMFPISAKRMIVEIDPFYKFRIEAKDIYDMPKLDYLTRLNNEKLFYPNTNKYILPQDGIPLKYHQDDLYIYEIKKLTRKETRYCNELFLDRINTWLGFSSINKVVGSIVAYKRDNSYPYEPRVDYTELYKIINERYGSSIDIDTIKGFRR